MVKKIEKMVCSNSLSIGNVFVDNDHKKLFDICNELVDLVELNKDRKEFAKILSEMTDYARTHFKKEESYMKAFSYPEISEHIKSHHEYIRKVAMDNFHFMMSPDFPDPVEIIAFIKTWWSNHILYCDIKYENYKKRVQANANY
ncbi:MAG: bacteriohemerythrin [Mangrovibacterium sp.]